MAAYFVKFRVVPTPRTAYDETAIISYKKGEKIDEESFIKKIQERRGMKYRVAIEDITKL